MRNKERKVAVTTSAGGYSQEAASLAFFPKKALTIASLTV